MSEQSDGRSLAPSPGEPGRGRVRAQTCNDIRRRAVALTRLNRSKGRPRPETAARLGLSPTTLARWEHCWQRQHLASRKRGRPPIRCDRETRRAVLAIIWLIGPRVGVPALAAFFPEVARAVLTELLGRYRRAFCRHRRWLLQALSWRRPRTIWAADLTRPPRPVDGRFPYILVVRDLASGNHLLALPLPDKSAVPVAEALGALFEDHGAPLVLKTDNGSEFIGEATVDCLHRHNVVHLRSPEYFPRFNGACEAGIGSLKVHAAYQAARNDRPGEWTCDDVEAARLVANLVSRPRGPKGPSPDQAWEEGVVPTKEERDVFGSRLRDIIVDETDRQVSRKGAPLTARERRCITRVSIARTLTELEYLVVRRRRIPAPISRRHRVNIS